MIYTFRLVSDEVDNFMREIKIDADASGKKLTFVTEDLPGKNIEG